MKSTVFWLLTIGITVSVYPAYSQAMKTARIGYVSSFGAPPETQIRAFRQGLRELGYIEGNNISILFRHPRETSEEVPDLVTELLKSKIDILIAVDPTAIRSAKRATANVPIVMLTNQDPVAIGLVDSLARPGGNVTGITRLNRELSGKRLELLREVIPTGSRFGVLWVPPSALGTGTAFKAYEAAAAALKVQLLSLQVGRSKPELDTAFQTAVNERLNALIVVTNAVFRPHQKEIAALAIRNRLPTLCELTDYVDAGCLMSYSTDDGESFRRAATYVDKILKGAKPAELPVEQPTKFELALNLKTARQIRLTISPNVAARADKVIK